VKVAAISSLVCIAFAPATAQTACVQPHPTAQYSGPLTRGRLLEHPVPAYPERAKSRGISGLVTFRAHILEDGTIGHLTALSGPPELQESVEKTLYRWRYTPYTANGQPVDVYTSIPVGFGNGSAGPAPTPTGQKISALELQGLLVRSYPAKRSKEAEKANVSGPVTLHVTLDKTGRIADLGVLCGAEQLEDAALETVRHWIYRPYLSNGQPVSVESTIDVQF
jgi:TonB family protein